MKPPRFEYVRAESVAHALEALVRGGDEAKLLAGGQSLLPLLNFRMARPSLLVDIGELRELAYVRPEGDWLAVGALTRHRELERQGFHPLLAAAGRHIGHQAIRRRGTVGGSLVHADPTAEWALMAAALDAEFTLCSPAGERTATAADFFLTYFTTTIGADEMLTEVRFPLLAPGMGWSFQEVARRHGDFAIVAVAATVTLGPDGKVAAARLAVAGGGATPLRATAAESALLGAEPDPAALEAVAAEAVAGLEPDDDLHASAEFRRHLAGTLVRRALEEAVGRCAGGERA